MESKLTKLNIPSIAIIIFSLVPMILGLFPYSIELNFVVLSISNLLFGIYYFYPKTKLKFYLLIIFSIPIVAFSILYSVQLRYPTALLSSLSANLLLFFGLIFKSRIDFKISDIYNIMKILIFIIFVISLLSLVFLKTAIISFLGFQIHSFYLIIFLFSIVSGINNFKILRILIFSFSIYSFLFFIQKGLNQDASVSFKMIISSLSLFFLAFFDYRNIKSFSFLKIYYSKLKLNIFKFNNLLVYLTSIIIFPITIILVSLNYLTISRSFSLFIRITTFKAIFSSLGDSIQRFLFGFGPGSTSERFNLTEFITVQVGDGTDDITSVASHSMPLELIYEFGALFTFILSVLFVFKILNLNTNISFLSKLYFLLVYLMANIIFPVVSTCVYPMSQSFLILLIIIIQYKPKIINK